MCEGEVGGVKTPHRWSALESQSIFFYFGEYWIWWLMPFPNPEKQQMEGVAALSIHTACFHCFLLFMARQKKQRRFLAHFNVNLVWEPEGNEGTVYTP